MRVDLESGQPEQKAGTYSPKTNWLPHFWDDRSPPDGCIVAICGQNEGHWRGGCNTISFQGKSSV